MEATFGHEVDYATIVKHYAVEGTATDAAHRYSPSKVTGSERTVIRGRPAEEYISTSYVERFNLSTRMQMRRFTRLTNAFSKKLANHLAAIALWVCFYNLCRVHETLRMTPAMAVGVTDHIWTIGELIDGSARAGRRTAATAGHSPRYAGRAHTVQTVRDQWRESGYKAKPEERSMKTMT